MLLVRVNSTFAFFKPYLAPSQSYFAPKPEQNFRHFFFTLPTNIFPPSPALEAFFPAFKDRIVEICKLTDFKLRLCMLIKLGFSIAEIAHLTQHSAEAVTSARRRMAQKAFGEGSTPGDWDDFILSL